jgi:hypothetical protein
MITRVFAGWAFAYVLPAFAQQATPHMVPGPPPDEYVDVTGDGIADLLINTRTVHVSDPEQPGYFGKYMLGVRTLSGTSILMWSTPSNQRWYTLEDSTRLDAGLLAKRIHFKQLSWTDEDQATEFWLLERPFGPAITKDQDGWSGTGDHHDGHTMVLRSANERGPKVTREYDFGHEENEPQVIVPPGIPPDERVNLNSDEVDDLVITGTLEQGRGERSSDYFVRGLSPLPGTEFLMTRERWGVFGFFRLREGEVLTPERLATGLRSNVYAWANTDTARVFIPVLRYLVGMPAVERRWSLVEEPVDGSLVYRTKEYDRPIIGTLEIIAETPGGQFGVRPQTWVEEGQVLEVR